MGGAIRRPSVRRRDRVRRQRAGPPPGSSATGACSIGGRAAGDGDRGSRREPRRAWRVEPRDAALRVDRARAVDRRRRRSASGNARRGAGESDRPLPHRAGATRRRGRSNADRRRESRRAAAQRPARARRRLRQPGSRRRSDGLRRDARSALRLRLVGPARADRGPLQVDRGAGTGALRRRCRWPRGARPLSDRARSRLDLGADDGDSLRGLGPATARVPRRAGPGFGCRAADPRLCRRAYCLGLGPGRRPIPRP